MVSSGKYKLTFPVQMTAQTYAFTLTRYDTSLYINRRHWGICTMQKKVGGNKAQLVLNIAQT